jgi:hypothetical protein
MSNDDNPHSITIPAHLWRWAQERCAEAGQGPASYLRNILIGAATRDSGSAHQQRSANGEPKKTTGGKAVHMKCYDEMVDDYERRHPGEDPPNATPWTAERTTICPRCHRAVSPDDPIALTSIADWN